MLWRDTDKKKGKLVRSFWFFWFFDGVTSKVYNRNNSIHAILLSLFLHLSFLAFPGLKFMTIRFVSTDQEKNSGGVKENGSSDRSRRLTFSNVHSMEDEMEKNGREGKYTLLLFLLSLESQNGKQSTRSTQEKARETRQEVTRGRCDWIKTLLMRERTVRTRQFYWDFSPGDKVESQSFSPGIKNS